MAYRDPHFWQHTSDKIYGTVHIHVVPDASEQKIIAYVSSHQFIYAFYGAGAVVAVIIWKLDLQLPMQSVSITTDVVSSNLDQGEVYNIM